MNGPFKFKHVQLRLITKNLLAPLLVSKQSVSPGPSVSLCSYLVYLNLLLLSVFCLLCCSLIYLLHLSLYTLPISLFLPVCPIFPLSVFMPSLSPALFFVSISFKFSLFLPLCLHFFSIRYFVFASLALL